MPQHIPAVRLTDSVSASSPANSSGEHQALPVLRKVSMSSVTTYRWSLLEDVVHARDFGYRGIGVWRTKLASFGEERGIELLRDAELEVASVSWIGGFTGANGYSLRESICDARETIDIAAEVGAETVIVASGPRAGHTAKHARRLVVTAMKRLAPFAAERGVQLALLPMHSEFASEWTFLNCLDDAMGVIDDVESSALGLAFDAFHLREELDLMQRIPTLIEKTAIVQLSDYKQASGCDAERCLPGEGDLSLDVLIETFERHGYEGYFDIQIWSEDVWASDYLQVLESCRAVMHPACV